MGVNSLYYTIQIWMMNYSSMTVIERDYFQRKGNIEILFSLFDLALVANVFCIGPSSEYY